MATIHPEGVGVLFDFSWQLATPTTACWEKATPSLLEAPPSLCSNPLPVSPTGSGAVRLAAVGRAPQALCLNQSRWEQLHRVRSGARGNQSAWGLLLGPGTLPVSESQSQFSSWPRSLWDLRKWGSQCPTLHCYFLANLAQGIGGGAVEMSPAGININKKQMDLRGGQLSINQTARPLMANTTQVGPCETFSWPPPGRTSLLYPHSLPGSSSPPGLSGANSRWERGEVPGVGDWAVSPGLFGGTLPSGTSESEGPSTHLCPTLWALPPPYAVLCPLVGACCSLFRCWQLPYWGQSLLKSLIGN